MANCSETRARIDAKFLLSFYKISGRNRNVRKINASVVHDEVHDVIRVRSDNHVAGSEWQGDITTVIYAIRTPLSACLPFPR